MCEPTKKLKLCTCTEKLDKTQDHWTLSRKKIIQPLSDEFEIDGMLALKEHKNQNLVEWIISELNNTSTPCFDSDYQPLDEDKLILRLQGKKFVLIFNGFSNEWALFDNNPFKKPIKRSVQAKGYAYLNSENKK